MPDIDGSFSWRRVQTGKFNTSFFVSAGDRELVLRIAPPEDTVFVFYERGMMSQEPGLHRLLLENTNVPVAPVLLYDDSHDQIDRDYMVMQRMPGRPLTETAGVDMDHVLRQVGRYLRETHGLIASRHGYGPGYGYLGEHRPHEPRNTWAAAFQLMWHKMIDDVAAVGHYAADEQVILRGLFDRPVVPSLLHMDIWHQNIMVDEAGEVTAIIDWDRALWGDPEIEFAVLDYCGISEPAFWEGYGTKRETCREASIRQIFYLLYELQKYIVIRRGRNGDAAAARSYKRQVMDIVRMSKLAQ